MNGKNPFLKSFYHTLAAIEDGVWLWDLTTDKVEYSENFMRMLHSGREDFEGTIEDLKSRIHPEDKEAFIRQLKDHAAGINPLFAMDFRCRRRNGEYLWVKGRGRISDWSKAGMALQFIGIVTDIDAYKKVQQLLHVREELSVYAWNHSLEELMRKTLDETEKLTGSSIGFFHFYEEGEKKIKLQVWSTNTMERMCNVDNKKAHYALTKAGVWADAIRLEKTIIHNDYLNLYNKKGLPQGHTPVLREIVTPVIEKGKVVAIMGVGNKKSPYDDSDRILVENFSRMTWEILQLKKHQEADHHRELH